MPLLFKSAVTEIFTLKNIIVLRTHEKSHLYIAVYLNIDLGKYAKILVCNANTVKLTPPREFIFTQCIVCSLVRLTPNVRENLIYVARTEYTKSMSHINS